MGNLNASIWSFTGIENYSGRSRDTATDEMSVVFLNIDGPLENSKNDKYVSLGKKNLYMPLIISWYAPCNFCESPMVVRKNKRSGEAFLLCSQTARIQHLWNEMQGKWIIQRIWVWGVLEHKVLELKVWWMVQMKKSELTGWFRMQDCIFLELCNFLLSYHMMFVAVLNDCLLHW